MDTRRWAQWDKLKIKIECAVLAVTQKKYTTRVGPSKKQRCVQHDVLLLPSYQPIIRSKVSSCKGRGATPTVKFSLEEVHFCCRMCHCCRFLIHLNRRDASTNLAPLVSQLVHPSNMLMHLRKKNHKGSSMEKTRARCRCEVVLMKRWLCLVQRMKLRRSQTKADRKNARSCVK